MTIRRRITLLMVFIFAAISAIGGYAIYQSRSSAGEVKAVTEGVVPSALASADLVSELKNVQLATMVLVSAPDQNLAAQAQEKLATSKTMLQKAIALQDSMENYFAAIDDSIKLKAAGKIEMSQANLFGNVVQYQDELEQIVDTLRIEKNRVKDKAISTLNDNLGATATTISCVTVIAVLILTAIGVLLYRQIIGPISRMQIMMTEIAVNQDFSRRVPVDRMDEIGHSVVAFNEMISKIEESSTQIKQRTADIQAILQNMPQGILTVIDGLKIHHEYSAYLEKILETNDIANHDVMELVFNHSNLGADILAQLDAACRACIGEDVMNFDFNEHLLVDEVEIKMQDGRIKMLDLSWSPITDDEGITKRLMLCVRDVTELRALAAEAHEQKKKLEIIGEILAVSQEKFHEFIVSTLEFINRNELIIRTHLERDEDAVAELFRNMHTIKGNARTYGLKHLTNIVHEAEQTYDELRKGRPKFAWDQEMLLEELSQVREAADHYAKINEASLGRKGPGRRGNVERYLMVDKAHIHESLHRLETVNTSSLHELVAVRNAVKKTLRLLGTESMEEILTSIVDSMPALAKELGKEVPRIQINDNGHRIHHQASAMLKNVFMHLFRNAMDHGIETSEVRQLQDKATAGTIQLDLANENDMLKIEMQDDGRGLGLARIRGIAAEKGIIDMSDCLDDSEIAQLIFRPGFSTASQVTEVSGRGVGMDAVQEFVKREHGKIEIHFVDDMAGADYRQFKTVVLLPKSVTANSNEEPAATHLENVTITSSATHVEASHASVSHTEANDLV
jgi:two-component system chemotaxis sensor kinase CheA